jgi:hypothetical protein
MNMANLIEKNTSAEACSHVAPPTQRRAVNLAADTEACCHFAPPTQRQTKSKGNLIQMALYRHLNLR